MSIGFAFGESNDCSYSYNTQNFESNSFVQEVNPFASFDTSNETYNQAEQNTFQSNNEESIFTSTSEINSLKSEFQSVQNEQGAIGSLFDFGKNLFNTQDSSSYIQNAIDGLDENSTQEEIQQVRNLIDSFDSSQEESVKTTATGAAMMAGGTIGAKAGAAIGTAVCPGLGTLAGIAIGAIVGGVTSILVNQVENSTDKVENNEWQNDKNLLEEGASGAIAGANAVMIGGIAQKATGIVGSKIGLSTTENAVQGTTSALAEQTTNTLTKTTVAKNIFAGAVGNGSATAVVMDTEYAANCFTSGKDFSVADFGGNTVSQLAIGGMFGGANGLNFIPAKILAKFATRG